MLKDGITPESVREQPDISELREKVVKAIREHFGFDGAFDVPDHAFANLSFDDLCLAVFMYERKTILPYPENTFSNSVREFPIYTTVRHAKGVREKLFTYEPVSR